MDILLILRIRTYDNILINLIEIKIENEIPIQLINFTKFFIIKERQALIIKSVTIFLK